MPENLPEVGPEPLVTTETRDGSRSSGKGSDDPEVEVAIAPVRKDEPIVTRKVRLPRYCSR